MNRKEKIEKAAYKYAQYGVLGSSANGVWRGFVDGANWADNNPNPWHSVKDGELPQVYTTCLFRSRAELLKGFMDRDRLLHISDKYYSKLYINEVDYWMEIPELPTELE